MQLAHHHPAPADGGRSPLAGGRAGERGETLAEVLTTVVLMGIGFVAVLSAIITSVNVATVNQDRTIASLTVQSWAENLQQPSLFIPAGTPAANVPAYYTYVNCATSGSYSLPSTSDGSLTTGFTATIVNVELLNNFASGQPNFNQPLGNCYSTRDNGLQRITLKVESQTHKGKKAVETVTFVKRDQRCPTGFDNADLGPC